MRGNPCATLSNNSVLISSVRSLSAPSRPHTPPALPRTTNRPYAGKFAAVGVRFDGFGHRRRPMLLEPAVPDYGAVPNSQRSEPMRSRLLGAFAALIGCAAVAAAQTPAAPALPVPVAPPVAAPAVPPGMMLVPATPAALPPASLPAPPAAPPVMASNPNCGTPAAAPACNECNKAKKANCGGGLLSKFLIGSGTATPVACGCLAAERTFMFGGCRSFFTPGKTCCGGGIEYGPGGMGQTDNCKSVGSFHNR